MVAEWLPDTGGAFCEKRERKKREGREKGEFGGEGFGF